MISPLKSKSPVQKAPNQISYLITGGKGFLGTHLANHLVNLKNTKVVRILDLAVTPKEQEESFQKWSNGSAPKIKLQFIRGDCCNLEHLAQSMAGIDVVYHIAALVTLGDKHPFDYSWYFHRNVVATHKVVEACRRMNICQLIFTSSISVVMNPNLPQLGMDENQPYPNEHVDHYAKTKCIAEKHVLANNGKSCFFAKQQSFQKALHANLSMVPYPIPSYWPTLSTCVIRPGLIFGPGMGEDWKKRIKAGGLSCPVFSESYPSRNLVRNRSAKFPNKRETPLADWVYVTNVCHALVLASKNLFSNRDLVAGQKYFITNREPWTYGEFFTRLRHLSLFLEKNTVQNLNLLSKPQSSQNTKTPGLFSRKSPLTQIEILQNPPRYSSKYIRKLNSWIFLLLARLFYILYFIYRTVEIFYASLVESKSVNPLNTPLKIHPPARWKPPVSPSMVTYLSNSWTYDASLSEQHLGYKPLVSMEQGCINTALWLTHN